MEKALPAHMGAEQEILGGLLCVADRMHLIADRLRPGDFYYRSCHHPEIYTAMCSLYEHNQEINALSVEEKLAHLAEPVREIKDRPVHHYLTELWEIAYYAVADIEAPTKLVLNLSMKRKQYAFLSEAGHIIASEEDAGLALDKIQQLLFDLDAGRTSEDLVSGVQVMSDFMNYLDQQQQRAKSHVVGIPTGFEDLDTLLGGMQPQELYILGGRPGTGKTSFMLNMVHHLLFREQYKIAIFSLEMSRNDLARRLTSMESGIDSQRLRFSKRLLEDGELNRIVAASDRLSRDNFYVDQSGDLSIAAMRSKARRHKVKHGLDLVIVDYLQLMSSDTEEKNRVVEVGKISRGLKQLAKSLDVPVLALAQLSRAVETRAVKRPQLSDLRESGSIEADADVVMLISQEQDYSVLEIAKHRNGPQGEDKLYFNGALTTFQEVSDAEQK